MKNHGKLRASIAQSVAAALQGKPVMHCCPTPEAAERTWDMLEEVLSDDLGLLSFVNEMAKIEVFVPKVSTTSHADGRV